MMGIIMVGVAVMVGIDGSQILLEQSSDCLSVLIDYQPLAMGQHQRALFAQKACRTNVQNLVWIDKDFFSIGR